MKIMRDGIEYELTSEDLLSRHTTDIAKETARQKENVSIGHIIPGSNPHEKNNSAA